MPVMIKGKRYSTVWERLNAAHGEGLAPPVGIQEVITEIVATTPLVIVRATITFDGGRRFSGLSEAQLDAPANSADGTNPVECAETSAVGRALAFAGYPGSGDGIAGAEEVGSAQRRSAAPPRQPAPTLRQAPPDIAPDPPDEYAGAVTTYKRIYAAAKERQIALADKWPATPPTDAPLEVIAKATARLREALNAVAVKQATAEPVTLAANQQQFLREREQEAAETFERR